MMTDANFCVFPQNRTMCSECFIYAKSQMGSVGESLSLLLRNIIIAEGELKLLTLQYMCVDTKRLFKKSVGDVTDTLSIGPYYRKRNVMLLKCL